MATPTSEVKIATPWPNVKEDYELMECIGVGATAFVHKARCIPRNEECAIKKINLEKWNTNMEELLKEIQAMSQCHHENVVTYHTSFVVGDELWLILKLLSGGSLLDIIKKKVRTTECHNGVFDETFIATALKEVLKGLEYFHNNGQIHRDIKAGNILLGENGEVQIADFGVSAWLSTAGDMSREKNRYTFVGTPCWMAPEVMEQVQGYDFKADIWSFGITAIEMVTGTAPYHKFPPMKVLMLTIQNDPPSLDTNATDKDQYKAYGKSLRKMIADCLQKEPAKRPTATELLKHPFFKKAKDKRALMAALKTDDTKMEPAAPPTRVPGTSGRFHRTHTGDWVWSDDEDQERGEAEDAKPASSPAPAPASPPPALPEGPQYVAASALAALSLADGAGPGGAERPAAVAEAPAGGSVAACNQVELVLRVRNQTRDLNDIRFDFRLGQDTAVAVASELVAASLVDQRDLACISAALERVLQRPRVGAGETFALSSGCLSHETQDEQSLVGFAQITVTE